MDSYKAINSLEKAISKIKSDYVSYYEPLDNYGEKVRLQVERNFTYELYYQWSKVLNKWIKRDELRISAEIPKEVSRKKRVYPDLVLHKGQHSIKSQLLAIEVKRCDKNYPSEKEILKDLKKLVEFLTLKKKFTTENSDDAKFDSVFFIMTNCEIDQLREKICNAYTYASEADKTRLRTFSDKIWCMAVYPKNGYLTSEKILLSEIIN